MAKKKTEEQIETAATEEMQEQNRSPRFELVKAHYSAGLWKLPAVKRAVACSWITKDEFSEITGANYE